jgi:hypothetical protein
LNLDWFTSCGEVCRPACLGRFLALGRERGDVAAFKATNAEWHAMERETVLLAEIRAELTSVRRIHERAVRYERVGAVVFKEINKTTSPRFISLGGKSNTCMAASSAPRMSVRA